jgi:hypothetical protein
VWLRRCRHSYGGADTSSSLGSRGRLTDVIAYIDGFNLYNGLKSKYRHRYLWLDQ